MSEKQEGLSKTITSALLSAAVAAALVGGIMKYYLDSRLDEIRSQRSFDLAAMTELVGPAVMQFDRSKAVARRYSQDNNQFFGDAAILNEANRFIRSLLLAKGHLMSAKLRERSQCVVQHYDIWLQRFEKTLADFKRTHNGQEPLADERFDVGYAALANGAKDCGNFPDDVPILYLNEMNKLKAQLFEAA